MIIAVLLTIAFIGGGTLMIQGLNEPKAWPGAFFFCFGVFLVITTVLTFGNMVWGK